MPTKAELEEQLAEQEARIQELEAIQAIDDEAVSEAPQPQAPEPVKGPVTEESINQELRNFDVTHSIEGEESTYMRDLWEHRTQSEAFVRAFAWAKKKGNQLKACLIFADAHENEFESSDEPVVNRD